jgi:hypothetical protein
MERSTKVLLVLFILMLGALVALRKPILEGRMMPGFRVLMMYVVPPKDLFVPVLKVPVNTDSGGAVVEAVFTNHYAGRYSVGVMAENMSQNAPIASQEFRFSIQIFDGPRHVFSEVTEGRRFFFWGKYGSGMSLAGFTAPDPVPVGRPLRCRIEVIQPDPVFQKQHGPLSVYVQKDSEY